MIQNNEFTRAGRIRPVLHSPATLIGRCVAACLVGLVPCVGSGAPAADDSSRSLTPDDVLEEITVTARKQPESIVHVPGSITAFGTGAITAFNIQDFADYATKVPNLSFAYGAGAFGGGATQALSIQIRGISGTGTTGFYIDDTPVPNTIDPRVVDLQRVETLKGPQGTLFGASSMGGNVRLITNAPNLDQNGGSYMVQGGGTSGGGSPDYGGNVIANFVAVPDRFAVRVMAFGQHDAGFLTNTYPAPSGVGMLSSSNQDQISTYGGSVTALGKFTDRLDITLRLMGQDKDYHGLPEAFAPLPSFTPVYTLNRTTDAQESAFDRFLLSAIEINYDADAYKLTSSTSYFYNHSYEIENGTEGTDEFFAQNFGVQLNPSIPFTAAQDYTNRQITEETRVSISPFHDVSGVVGLFYSHQDNTFYYPAQVLTGLAASGLYSSDLLFVDTISQTQDNAALFGEVYYKFLKNFTLTLGGRAFYLRQTELNVGDGFFNGGPIDSGVQASHQTGFSPKVALSYAVTDDTNVYALYSKGFRPGGPLLPLPSSCQANATAFGLSGTSVRSDTVDNFEVGAKSSILNGRAYVSAAVFQMNWSDIQQLVFLQCGLNVLANTGDARIRGGESEINGELFEGFDARAGIGAENAVITNPGSSPLYSGERIFEVPKLNATVGFNYKLGADWNYHPFISADYSYVSDRLSGTSSETSPLLAPGYSLLNARAGLTFGRSTLSFYADNLTNTKANLGDIQQISFNQTTVSAQGQTVPYLRVGVLHPLKFGIQFKQSF